MIEPPSQTGGCTAGPRRAPRRACVATGGPARVRTRAGSRGGRNGALGRRSSFRASASGDPGTDAEQRSGHCRQRLGALAVAMESRRRGAEGAVGACPSPGGIERHAPSGALRRGTAQRAASAPDAADCRGAEESARAADSGSGRTESRAGVDRPQRGAGLDRTHRSSGLGRRDARAGLERSKDRSSRTAPACSDCVATADCAEGARGIITRPGARRRGRGRWSGSAGSRPFRGFSACAIRAARANDGRCGAECVDRRARDRDRGCAGAGSRFRCRDFRHARRCGRTLERRAGAAIGALAASTEHDTAKAEYTLETAVAPRRSRLPRSKQPVTRHRKKGATSTLRARRPKPRLRRQRRFMRQNPLNRPQTAPGPTAGAEDKREERIPSRRPREREPRALNSGGRAVETTRGSTEWPSAKDILATHRAAATATASNPKGPVNKSRAGRAAAVPTLARGPEKWSLPAWLAGPPAALLVMIVGLAGCVLSCWWAGDAFNAAIMMDRLLSADRSALRRPLPESVVPPESDWMRSTASHLAHWAIFLARYEGGERQRPEEIVSLLERALEASPINREARLAIAQLEPSASTRSVSVRSLGLSRDAVSLAWSRPTATGRRRKGRRAQALRPRAFSRDSPRSCPRRRAAV